MLIAVLLSLSAISVNAQFGLNGFRKNRQLDLQDIEKSSPTEQSKPDDLDFVPPLSNTYLPARLEPSPSQQTFESGNVNGKQKELCKAPFDSPLCKGDDVEKPSQDLVPPFNNIEEGGKTTAKPQSEDAPTTVAAATEQAEAEPEGTTVKVTTMKAAEPAQTTAAEASSAAVETSSAAAETSSAAPEESSAAPESSSVAAESSSAASVAAATTAAPAEVTTVEKAGEESEGGADQGKSLPSSGREYLPPPPGEIAAAAQTNIAVIEPLNQPDHDHHHHHHDANFNICDDPFHSFLCAPLKTRRRITGALPDKFKGSNSFLQYQKVLPNYFGNQGASSNAINNAYLPPKTNGFSGNQIQTTYASFTTKEPVYTTTTTAPPYSQYSTYTTSRPVSQYNTYTTSRPLSQYNTYTTSRPNSQFNTYTTSRPYSPFSQNSNNYVPPYTGGPTSNPAYYNSPSNQVFGSRIPTTPAASTIKTVDNTFIPSSTFGNGQSTYKTPNPSFPTYRPFSPNDDRSYLPPDQKFPSPSFASPVQNYYQPSTSSRPQTSTFGSGETYNPPNNNYVYQKPSPTYQPFGSYNTVTSSPAYQNFGSFNSGTSSVRPGYSSPFSSSYKPTSQGVYNTNQPKYQAGANYISTTVKPFTAIKSQAPSQDNYYLPPDPREPAAAQISSATVAAPQSSKPFHHGRDLCTDPFHSFLCSGPKPRKRITGALPLNNAEQRAPASSNQNENIVRPEGAPTQNSGYKYPVPSNTFPTPSATLPPFSGTTGYSYPKPSKGFPLPSQQEETKVTTEESETSSTGNGEAKSANGYETSQSGSGYETSKPTNGQETSKPSNGHETSQSGNGYEPQKPSPTDQSVKVVTSVAPTSGYTYQRPQKTSPISTEQKEVRQRPVESSTYRQSGSTRGKGYQYNKPDQSFRLPDKKGYSYPKPDKRFELPSEGRRKSLPSQANSNLDPVRNLGSADFIPVNKVDFKRSRPTNSLAAGLKRFGERLRIHEKRI